MAVDYPSKQKQITTNKSKISDKQSVLVHTQIPPTGYVGVSYYAVPLWQVGVPLRVYYEGIRPTVTEGTAYAVAAEYPHSTELSICTTDGSYDGKTPNVASSPRRLSGPLRVVALGGPTEDKFDACAHEWNCYLTVAESIRRQIESSPVPSAERYSDLQ